MVVENQIVSFLPNRLSTRKPNEFQELMSLTRKPP